MSNLENVKLSNTSKMIVAAAAVTAGTLVQVNQNNQMVNADETKAAIKNLGQSVNTYKVQSGDTLTKIAKANDVSLDDLVKFNGIADKNMIIVGETLQLSANDDVKSTDVTTDDTYTAVDGTNISDLQYNANADADNDNFMTVSEYNAWVNGGRQETVAPSEAATDDAASTETAAPSDDTTVATSDANAAVDGTNVADLQYNANADADNDGFMTVSEYNAWVNGGRQETVVAPKATTDDAASTETTTPAPSENTTTNNNSQNQGSWYDVAMSLVGIPYVWGGHTPSAGLDCSGFTAWVYNHSGMTSNFPAYTVAQENATTSISVSAAQPGDLLFWGTPGATYHVGIYLGNNQFIAAPQPGDVVRVQTLTAGWMPSFAGTLR